MKTYRFFLLFSLIVLQLASCKKDVADSSTSLPVTANAVAGNFTVSSFVTTTDQTALFNGYRFVFSDNGTVTATKDNASFNGTWRFDDSNNSEMKLNFNDSPLNELNRSWHIDELTTEHTLLTDDDAGDDSNDDHPSSHNRLQFERE